MTDLPKFVTTNTKYRTLFDERQRVSREARAAQNNYRRSHKALILSTVGASVTGGVLLYVADLDPAKAAQLSFLSIGWVQTLLVVFQAICIGVAATAAYVLARRKFNERWQTARVAAETLRRRIEVCALELGFEGSDKDLQSVAANFQSFVRGQQTYHRNRADQAKKRSGSVMLFGAIVVGIAAAAGALASIDGAVLSVVFGLIGVVSPAMLAAFKSWEEINRSNEREKLHKHTATLLTEVLADWAHFDTAISQRDQPAAMKFTDRVFEILQADLNGFVEITKDKES